MTDIGTGSYTIIARAAAEMMGVPIEQVSVRLGDSAFPVSAGSVASGEPIPPRPGARPASGYARRLPHSWVWMRKAQSLPMGTFTPTARLPLTAAVR